MKAETLDNVEVTQKTEVTSETKTEKVETVYQDEKHEYEIQSTDEQVVVNEDEGQFIHEEQQFTWRSALVGSILGCLIAASNTYLGLKIGWTFGASLFGAVFSFAILKPLSRILPPKWGGGYFGPKENCTAQSAATTSGGLSAGFVAGIPAMYKMGLMNTPKEDAAALVLFAISAAFYGLFFAVPLRNHFVIQQDLPFPTPRAAAVTIESLHNTVEGEKEAMKKAKWMGFFFLFTFIWVLIAYWVPFFDTIHILWWIGHSANYIPMMSADEDWNWAFHFEWAFIGAGLMTPGATVVTFFVSSVLIYGIIGPSLVHSGYFVRPFGFVEDGPTTQSFFLWPGIALMVLTSFAELFVRYETLWRGVKGGVLSMYSGVQLGYIHLKSRVFKRQLTEKEINAKEFKGVPDDVYAENELVPTWWWVGGTFISIVFTCVIMGEYFHMPVYQSILAIVLAFIFSFVGVQASGETDINPTGAIGKMSQLVFSGIKEGSITQIRKNNLMAGNISASAASQAVDMVGDLKTGQLLRASPRSQFLAQFVASFFAIGVAVGLFILFADAYPCIISPEFTPDCEFGLVAVRAWYNVALLLTGGGDPLPKACVILTVICGVVGVAGPFVREFALPKKYHYLFPSLSAVGVAMINSSAYYSISMLVGWGVGQIWLRRSPKSHEDLMFSVAGGMVAGQGISAILQAVFKLKNIPPYAFVGSCMYQDIDYCP